MDELPPPAGLDDALSGGRPASLEDFRGVLSRHRRGQLQRLGAGLAAAVVVAAGVGYVAGQSGRSSGSTQITQSQAAGQPAVPAASSGAAQGGGGFSVGSGPAVAGLPETQLLVRNADDGVRIRLYQQALPTNAPSGACAPAGILQAEVSDDQVAGTAGGIEWSKPTAAALDPLSIAVVGAGEPEPILTVVSHTGAAVAKVVLSTAAGTDQAAPTTTGWVALAVQLPASATSASNDGVPAGTLTATAADGAVLATDQLNGIDTAANAPPCQGTNVTCRVTGTVAPPEPAATVTTGAGTEVRIGTMISGSGCGCPAPPAAAAAARVLGKGLSCSVHVSRVATAPAGTVTSGASPTTTGP